jgi:hypothetical protein
MIPEIKQRIRLPLTGCALHQTVPAGRKTTQMDEGFYKGEKRTNYIC